MKESRYQKHYDLSGFNAGMQDKPAYKRKQNPWADALRMVGTVAPAVGTAAGGILGGVIGAGAGGVGALPGAGIGAGIGGALGQGAGMLATGGADMMTQGEEDKETQALADANERRARQMAALQMLGGLG